jgi:uncharacterized metal-binding protein
VEDLYVITSGMVHSVYVEDLVLVIAGIKVTVGLIVTDHGIAEPIVNQEEMHAAINMITVVLL